MVGWIFALDLRQEEYYWEFGGRRVRRRSPHGYQKAEIKRERGQGQNMPFKGSPQ
jgi:hypothetical protein